MVKGYWQKAIIFFALRFRKEKVKMINSNPLVSVLMTCYNREKFIAEAIQSVLNSTYTNFELIIVDDSSTDNTFSIAKSYQQKDGRIKLFLNENNLGQFQNRNKAAEYAVGEFLMNVDSDDTIYVDGIEKCIDAMLSFPESSFGSYLYGIRKDAFVLESKIAIKKHFFENAFLVIGPGGTIIRRSFFNEINRYPVIYEAAGDMYFNLKATCFSPIVLLPFEFMFYRRHEGQEINNSYSYLIYNYKYLKDALAELPLQLNKKEVGWLNNKNNRRFLVNITKFFLKTFDYIRIREALRKTGFGYKEGLKGIFHFD